MARVKLTGVVTELSGSINGTTFQGGQWGLQAGTKRFPVNRQNTRMRNYRVQFAYVAKEWRNLTDTQRDAWDAIAPMGQSGYYTFLQTNVYRLLSGRSITTNAANAAAVSNVVQPLTPFLGNLVDLRTTSPVFTTVPNSPALVRISAPQPYARSTKSVVLYACTAVVTVSSLLQFRLAVDVPAWLLINSPGVFYCIQYNVYSQVGNAVRVSERFWVST